MKIRKHIHSILALTGLIAAIFVITVACTEKPSGHMLSNIEDNTVFKLYVKETPIGTIVNSIDLQGNYHREIIIDLAGQKMNMTMDITPDSFGDWKTIEINNTIYGAIHAQRSGDEAKYFIKGQKRTTYLPEGDYTLYDDYGNLLESVMIKKYDMNKKGKQVFKRFRIPETPCLGESIIEIELEFLETRKKTIRDTEYEFMIFSYKFLGMTIEFWVDKEYKIFMSHAPVLYAVMVREGYEELLPFKPGSSAPFSKNQAVD